MGNSFSITNETQWTSRCSSIKNVLINSYSPLNNEKYKLINEFQNLRCNETYETYTNDIKKKNKFNKCIKAKEDFNSVSLMFHQHKIFNVESPIVREKLGNCLKKVEKNCGPNYVKFNHAEIYDRRIQFGNLW